MGLEKPHNHPNEQELVCSKCRMRWLNKLHHDNRGLAREVPLYFGRDNLGDPVPAALPANFDVDEWERYFGCQFSIILALNQFLLRLGLRNVSFSTTSSWRREYADLLVF
jgi:hypothetical protein